jgi:hypothetical protein
MGSEIPLNPAARALHADRRSDGGSANDYD